MKHNQRSKPTETHDAASLAERLKVTVEAVEGLLTAGALNPVSSNENGDRLVFEREDLDALAAAIQSQVEDEVNEATEGQPARKREFAVARAKVLLEMQARESASNYRREIRLSEIRQAHEFRFGVGGEIMGGLVKWGGRFLKRPGATLAIAGKNAAKMPLSTPGIYARNAAVTGAAGSILGGARAALDGDEQTGVVGGMAKGAAVGAGVGVATTAAGRSILEQVARRRAMAGMPARLGNSPGFLPV